MSAAELAPDQQIAAKLAETRRRDREPPGSGQMGARLVVGCAW
jgi:hypothetical protein